MDLKDFDLPLYLLSGECQREENPSNKSGAKEDTIDGAFETFGDGEVGLRRGEALVVEIFEKRVKIDGMSF